MCICFESIKSVSRNRKRFVHTCTLLVFVVSSIKHNCSLLYLRLPSFIKNRTLYQPGNFIFKFQFKIKQIIPLHAKSNPIISIFWMPYQAWKFYSLLILKSLVRRHRTATTYHTWWVRGYFSGVPSEIRMFLSFPIQRRVYDSSSLTIWRILFSYLNEYISSFAVRLISLQSEQILCQFKRKAN
jgi:hypothetical protein